MLRPVDLQLSLWNVDQKSHQVRDPNAGTFQAIVQQEGEKDAADKLHQVQASQESEGEVQVRPDGERRGGGNSGRRRRRAPDKGEGEKEPSLGASPSGLDFLA
jgi:hypothetical protein